MTTSPLRDAIRAQARHLLTFSSEAGAVYHSEMWTTWGTLARIADDVERAYVELGVPTSAPVLLVAANRPNAVALILGAIACGRHPVMVSPSQPAQFVRSIAMRLGAAVVVLDRDAHDAGLGEGMERAGISLIVVPARDLVFGNVTAAPAEIRSEPVETPVDLDTAFSVLTSGTTGLPKPVAVPWQSIAVDPSRVPLDPSDPCERPPIIHALALSTITGARGVLGAALKGRSVAMLDRVEVDEWSRLVHRFRVRRAGLPPAAMRTMLENRVPPERLEHLQAWPTGSAPVDPELQREFEAYFGVPVLVSYGSSEIGGPATGWTLELHRDWIGTKIGSVGRARDGFEIRTVDPITGATVESEEIGLLEVRKPTESPGGSQQPWITTSDMARIDVDGFIFIIGRVDDVINRGGNKISLGELESVARSHADVRDAGAIDVPDPRLGQVPVMGVVLREESALTSDELRGWMRQRLVAYKVPREIRVLQALPMGASHKVDRARLREEFA